MHQFLQLGRALAAGWLQLAKKVLGQPHLWMGEASKPHPFTIQGSPGHLEATKGAVWGPWVRSLG